MASPLLANVFLHELDQFMERKMASFNRGAQRRHNPAWKRAQGPVYRLCKRIDQLKDVPGAEDEILRLRSRLEQVHRAQQQVPSKDPHDPGYRRLRYCRYADDFLIGVIGAKREAEQVLSDVSDFLTTIGLRASDTKTTVVKATTGARFLGYDVRRYDSQKVFKTVRGGRHTRMRAASGNMQLHVPTEKLRAFARNRRYGSLDTLTSCSRPALLRLSDAEIVAAYNAEMRGLAQFYALAYGAQSGQMHKLHFLWRGSLLKTLAHKHKSTVTKTVHVLKDGDRLGVRFEDAKGRTRLLRVWELRDLTRSPQAFGGLDDSTPAVAPAQEPHRADRTVQRQSVRALRHHRSARRGSPRAQARRPGRGSPVAPNPVRSAAQDRGPVPCVPPRAARRQAPRSSEVTVTVESPVMGNHHAGFGGGRRDDPAADEAMRHHPAYPTMWTAAWTRRR